MSKSYPTGIVYSKEIFGRLGIDAGEIKTYADFLNVCEKIKNSGIAPIVLGGADVWHIGFWWGYFWQREIGIKNPNWLAQRHEGLVRFTDPEVRAVVTGLYELFNRGYVERNWNSTAEAQCPNILVSGRAAMYYIGPFAFQQIVETDSEFGFGYFALPDNQGKINIIGTPLDTGWAISAEARDDPARAEAVYGFIRYFFSKEVYANYLGRTNAMSSLKEKIDYPVSEQFREVMQAVEKADNVQPNWHVHQAPSDLPVGFRNFCYRLVMQLFLRMHSIDDVLAALDQEWEASATAAVVTE
jgi:raffinose/stachyose/melibiose transport system substrate-binding protein